VSMLSEQSGATAPVVRVLIVYKHAFLRDLVTRVLDSTDVDIVAAVRPEDFSPFLVDALKPQAIVVDQAAFESGDAFGHAAVLGASPDTPLRVVVISLSDTNMLVWRKQVVTDADVEKLISAVRESPNTAAVSSLCSQG
jgi:chemotaxis response regulator CheB